jgi:hypothetical protein
VLAALSLGMTSSAVAFPRPAYRVSARIDPGNFGASYDGKTDDSVAMQKAVDACAEDGRWSDLVVSGPMVLGQPIMIDRPVDRSRELFRITGSRNARLIHRGGRPLFDSRIPMNDDPVSEYLSLANLSISGPGPLFSEKFLRVQLSECFLDGTSVMFTDKYIQSLELIRCRFVGSQGAELIRARRAYNVTIAHCNFERSESVMRIGAINGLSVIGCVFESCQQSPFNMDGVNGLTFNGNYVEGNGGPILVLGNNQGHSRGIAIFGNAIMGSAGTPKERFEIVLGRVTGAASGGNYCAGNLYDTSFLRVGDMQSMADAAEGKLTSTDCSIALVAADHISAAEELDLTATALNVISAVTTIVKGVTDESHVVELPVSVNPGIIRKLTIINAGGRPLLVRAPDRDASSKVSTIATVEPGCGKVLLEYEPNVWCAL